MKYIKLLLGLVIIYLMIGLFTFLAITALFIYAGESTGWSLGGVLMYVFYWPVIWFIGIVTWVAAGL